MAEAEEKTGAEVQAEADEKAEAEVEAEVETEEAKAQAEEGAKEEAEAESEEEAGAETKAEADAKEEAEEKAEAETEAKAGVEAESEVKREAEEKPKVEAEIKTESQAEQKPADEAEAGVDAVEKAATTDNVDGDKVPPVGGISETIQKMTRSAAVLPGESDQISLAMCAKDIMQRNLVWASGDDSVRQALTKMQQANASYMMVGAGGVLEGLVSGSDIAGAVSVYLRPTFAKWRRPLDDATFNIRIKWIATRPVHTIRPNTSLAAIMENMCQFGVRALPVTDERGKVQGLVTAFDIFRVLLSSGVPRPDDRAS